MPDLELIVRGSHTECVVSELSDALGEADVKLTARPVPSDAGTEHKAVDPIAVAAMLLSIPGAILAVQDLTDRIAKRRRAKALIEAAARIRIERCVDILAVTIEGQKALADLDPDTLLALVNQKDGPPEH